MPSQDYRTEADSLGEVRVPANALYMAQTQRAVENFPISGLRFGRSFIRALGLIKSAAAAVSSELGLIDGDIANAIRRAAAEVIDGRHDDQFPIDIFQTGSGTSTNMNANEVIATRAQQLVEGTKIHPNDHVNVCQSSNDVIPAAIHIAAVLESQERLLPALGHLHGVLVKKARETDDVVKTGRTHLMDAMPIRLSQQIGGWASQIDHSIDRILGVLPRTGELALGGTAVGTGINAHPEFGSRMAATLSEMTGGTFVEAPDHFEAQAAQDGAVELSGQLKTLAISLMKIANDLRWMNSGPQAGLAEIALPALQPGSSIMPGKINPVIPEAVMMVAAQVIGNDAAITVAASHGNFELLVMLPVIAHNLLQSLEILANASRVLADKAVNGFTVNREAIAELVEKNPIMVTALNPVIGYELGAKIAKQAYAQGRQVKEVAAEHTQLSSEELARLLDPRELTLGGIKGGAGGG
ncbi:MAG: class II fumarate hydratase [Acidobacteria bacterium]|nr:class II fumarate hydratase [Acidobacteriota bacterium]MCI0724041.1 class II fumarate hydratase [Acidobacteriota bacterium]